MIEIIVNKYVCSLIGNVWAMKVIFIAWTCFMNSCVPAQWFKVEYQSYFVCEIRQSFAYDNE